MKEQEELHKTEMISQQQGFRTTTDQMAETIAEKDRTIASLSRQYNRIDKTLENTVDDYNQLLAKANNLDNKTTHNNQGGLEVLPELFDC
jgi:flagellar hook-associated protein FlgK